MQVANAAFGQATHRVVDPADPPRDLSGWAWGVYVSFGLMAILGLGRLVSALDLRSTVTGGGDIVGSHDVYSGWTNIQTLLLLIAAGVFIAWFFQAYKNMRRLGVQNMRYGNGWAIGSWFVPILSLWRPKQIANDIWRGSERGTEVYAGWKQVPVPGLVHWWWGLFLAQGLLLYIGEQTIESGYRDLFAFGGIESGISQIKTGATLEVIGTILSIAAVATAIVFVSRVTERFAEIGGEALAHASLYPQYAQPQYAQPQYAQPQHAQPQTQYAQAQSYPPPAPQYMQPQPPLPAPATPGLAPPPSAPPPAATPQAAAEQLTRCPECAEWIQSQANVCRFCGYRLRPLGQ